jgi:hypothetical protein
MVRVVHMPWCPLDARPLYIVYIYYHIFHVCFSHNYLCTVANETLSLAYFHPSIKTKQNKTIGPDATTKRSLT